MKKILETLKLKWADYLLEILVIIIGILVAFTLNDWNDSRKQRNREIELLKTINSDLARSLDDVRRDLEAHLQSSKSGYIFKQFLLSSQTFQDSMTVHYDILNDDRQSTPLTIGYESMKSIGTDIISNDSLRLKITHLYQIIFPRIIEAGQSTEKYDIRKLLYPYYKKHFTLSNERSDFTGISETLVAYKYKIISYEMLKDDNEFLIDLQKSFVMRDRKIWLATWGVRRIEEVMLDIEEEMDKLE